MIQRALVLSLLIALACGQQACTADYQCGNPPYRYCNGAASDCPFTVPGLALDEAAKVLYFAVSCNVHSQDVYENITYQSLPVSAPATPVSVVSHEGYQDGGAPHTVVGASGNNIYYLFDYKGPTSLGAQPIPGLATAKAIGYQPFTAGHIDFDPSGIAYETSYNYVANDTFSGISHFLNRFDTTGDLSVLYQWFTPGITSLQTQTSGGVRLGTGNDILFDIDMYNNRSFVASNLYKGTTQCRSCNLPAVFVTLSEAVVDFDVTPSYIYYATSSGLYRIDYSTGGNQLTIFSGSVDGVQYSSSAGKVFYKAGLNIRVADANGQNDRPWSLPPPGSCACRSGFTGSSCQTCTGQVQWYNNLPSCVAVDVNGVPESCHQDYECGNAPFFTCQGNTCKCVNNFSGPRCNQCDAPKKVTWNGNYPTCA